jgi:hypothetical protein
MPISDEELAKEQERVASLRDQVVTERAKREEYERSFANDATYAALQAEGARLEAELAEERARSKAQEAPSAPAVTAPTPPAKPTVPVDDAPSVKE